MAPIFGVSENFLANREEIMREMVGEGGRGGKGKGVREMFRRKMLEGQRNEAMRMLKDGEFDQKVNRFDTNFSKNLKVFCFVFYFLFFVLFFV